MDSVGLPLDVPSLDSRVWRPASSPHRERLIVAALLVVAAGLRLWRLDEVPPGVFCDEAALALNAESIGRTGRNLGGELLPLYSEEKSFEAWGLRGIVYQPVFQYAAIPFVKAAEPSATTIRLPAVLFGCLGILGAYLLAREWFGFSVGFFTALGLSVLPWHHHFSRIGFEAISLPAILAFGVWLLWRGRERTGALLGGAALMALATYAYPSAKVAVPVLLLAFVVLFRKSLWDAKGRTLLAVAVLLVVALPNLYGTLAGIAQTRAQDLLITNASLSDERAVRFLESLGHASGLSRGILVPYVFLFNVVAHFTPDFLLLGGDGNLRHGTRGMGLLYFSMIPFVALGLFLLIRHRRDPRAGMLLAWIVAYPLASSLTVESPHAIRSLHGVPALAVLFGLGVSVLLARMRAGPRPRLAQVVGILAAIGLVVEVPGYLLHYHQGYPAYSAGAWQAGLGEAFRAAERERRTGDRVFVSGRILNGSLLAAFHLRAQGALPPASPELFARMRALGYRTRMDGPAGLPREGDLVLATAGEQAPKERLAEFPFPDGAPNLILFRQGRR